MVLTNSTTDNHEHCNIAPITSHSTKSSSRRCQQRAARINHSTSLANKCISSLNDLTCNTTHQQRTTYRHSTSSSTHQQRHVDISARRFCRLSNGNGMSGDNVDDRHSIGSYLNKVLPGRGEYATESQVPAISIVAANVSLPTVAATADMMSLLPSHIQQRYGDINNLLLPIEERRSAPRAFMVSPHEYIALVKRMRALGMLTFTRTPAVVNGLFGVRKGKSVV